MRKHNAILLLILLVFVKVQVFATQIQNQFVNYTVLDGLSHGAVNHIIQDNYGFLWFGTNNGLNMYDGKTFTVYRQVPGDTNSIESNYITRLAEDSNGNIWIGTNTGLNKLDTKTNNITRINFESEFYITEILQIDTGRIAVSTYNGLFLLDINNNSFKRYVIDTNTVNRFRVMLSYQNNLLIFAEGGIYTFDHKALKFGLLVPEANGFYGDDARTALMHNNTLWVGTTDNGVFFNDFDKNNNIQRFNLDILDDNTVYSSFINSERQLIFGCENRGLIIIDPEQRHHNSKWFKQVYNEFGQPNGLVNNSVYTIKRDNQNNLWLGTYNGVSCQYGNGMNFGSFSSQLNNTNTLFNSIVNSILQVDEYLWVATEGGVDIIEIASGKVIKHLDDDKSKSNSLLAAAVLDLEFDKNGNIWVGSWAGGIDIFDRQGNIIEKINNQKGLRKLSNNSVMCIERDQEGNMWVGTMGGGITVFSANGSDVKYYRTQFNNKVSLDNDWIKTILVTSSNEIWVSTHVGLELFDRKKDGFIHFLHEETDTSSLAANGVVCMKEDQMGNIWFGTPSGLSLFNRIDSTFTNFYTKHGLVNNHVLAIEEDAVGNLWLSSHSGLSKLVAGSFLTQKPVFENYDNRDGIISNEFVRRASCKTTGNDLCFGTRNGMVIFDPLKIVINNYIPNVYITGIYVNNEKLYAQHSSEIISTSARFVKNMVLNHTQSHISFDFAALNYVVPGKNQYKYKLIGFDNDWVNYDGSRPTYTNMPPGSYTFSVIASNNSDLWNVEGANLDLYIKPPWYRSKLAFIVYIILVFYMVFLYRYFIRRQTQLESLLEIEKLEKDNLNQVNKLKTKFFTNISHEFLTPLALIISPLESLLNKHPQLDDSIKPIYRNARRLQRLIDQILDISKIEADHMALRVSKGNLDAFVKEIFESFTSMAETKNIDFKLDINSSGSELLFDSDKIEKILYNVISNAVKFTNNGGEVKVTLNQLANNIELIVTDTGIGIAPEEKNKVFENFYRAGEAINRSVDGIGVGMSLVKGLVSIYGGLIELESELNAGSSFKIVLPYLENDFDKTSILHFDTKPVLKYSIIEDSIISNAHVPNDHSNDSNLPKLLIVEDNLDLNKHLVELLNGRYNTYSATDGKKGAEMAKEVLPDLIISDVVLPNLNGIELLEIIRNDDTTSHIPFIILTAKVDLDSRIESIEKGADVYITKPFDQKHLYSVIKNLLENREKLKNLYKKNIVVEPTQIQITSIDEKFIEKSIRIVEENFLNPNFNIEVLASEVGISRVQLHRKLTQLLGMSASNFVREIKIKRAAELLSKGQLTVSEVMYEVNIKSRAYFTKCFKETFGMLPTEYIKTKQKD